MATIDINRATSTLTEASFLISIILVVLGALIAQVMTEYLRSNVYDIPFQGGDALYPVVAAVLVLVVTPARYSRPIALGASATSVRVALDQWNIV